MRTLLATLLGVAVIVGVFVAFPEARNRAVEGLFGRKSEATNSIRAMAGKADAAAKSAVETVRSKAAELAAPAAPGEEAKTRQLARDAAQAARSAAGSVSESASGVLGSIRSKASALLENDAGGQTDEGGREVPAEPPAEATAAAEPEPAPTPAPLPAAPAPTVQIGMPQGLTAVRWGMGREQIEDFYDVAWHREQGGEVMLVYYGDDDRTQEARFHLAGDSLFRLEVRVRPAEGQTQAQVYDLWRESYAATYAGAREASSTRWYDGDVEARIIRLGEGIQLSLECAAARHSG